MVRIVVRVRIVGMVMGIVMDTVMGMVMDTAMGKQYS